MCQCPERGDLHFYMSTWKTVLVILLGVNALKGATFISTGIPNIYVDTTEKSVNALKGATFISTDMVNNGWKVDNVCQCPERGDLHFYKERRLQ